mgnify:CR=1 FL=1
MPPHECEAGLQHTQVITARANTPTATVDSADRGPLETESIRPAALMTDKTWAIEHDRAFLLDRREQWVHAPCPACEADEPEPFDTKLGFSYARCPACDTAYTTPRPGPELLDAFYRQSANYAYWNEHIFPATEPTRRERIFRPRAERLRTILDRLEVRTHTLMDVGAAFGTFCVEARDAGLADHVIALEPTPGLAATCRRRGLETIESTLESLPGDVRVNVLTAFEVIEHVFDPAAFVRRCTSALEPGGLLVLSCPNHRGFGVAGLGTPDHPARSGTFDHEHLNYFTPDSLPRLLTRCGLRVVEVLTPGELDADLVRQAALRGEISLNDRPLLREVLLDHWTTLGADFQQFLREQRLSSHLWVIAQKSQAVLPEG